MTSSLLVLRLLWIRLRQSTVNLNQIILLELNLGKLILGISVMTLTGLLDPE